MMRFSLSEHGAPQGGKPEVSIDHAPLSHASVQTWHERNATRQSQPVIRTSQQNSLPSISPLETMFPLVLLLASASAKSTTKALLMDIAISNAEAPLDNIKIHPKTRHGAG
jgi:hypothetical protein